MDYRYLGRSALRVSPLCLGTMMFGGATDEPTAKRIIDKARGQGINFLDAADLYNGGLTEEVVGRSIGGDRHHWVVATKFGHRMTAAPNEGGQSRKWIVQDVDDSLRRLGTDGEASVDYPDYGYKLAEQIASGQSERGIALCGSGIGIAIAANRNPAVRCAQVAEPVSARLARTHNDANAIALGSRLVGVDMAKACVEAFLGAEFSGGRHTRRVEKLSQITQDA